MITMKALITRVHACQQLSSVDISLDQTTKVPRFVPVTDSLNGQVADSLTDQDAVLVASTDTSK